MVRGKSQPPKQIMNAVAMESANRAYVQQTLNRLKEIANGEAPEIISEPSPAEEISNEIKVGIKKSNTRKKTAGEKKPARKASAALKVPSKAKKSAENLKKVSSSSTPPDKAKSKLNNQDK